MRDAKPSRERREQKTPNVQHATKYALSDRCLRKVNYFRQRIRNWYVGSGRSFQWRSASASQYHRIMSEVLLQRTRADTVSSFFDAFVARFPNWDALAKSTPAELGDWLKPIGLWKRRSLILHALAIDMTLRQGAFPVDRREVERLPGVGQYVANAILMFCHGRRLPLLDGSMARVLERFFGPRKLADIRYDPYLQSLARRVVSVRDPAVLNWAILDFATLVCRVGRPYCEKCPIAKKCDFFAATIG